MNLKINTVVETFTGSTSRGGVVAWLCQRKGAGSLFPFIVARILGCPCIDTPFGNDSETRGGRLSHCPII